MVGGTIRRKVIHRESFRASVLHLSEIQAVLQSIAEKKSVLTTPSLLSKGTQKRSNGSRVGHPPGEVENDGWERIEEKPKAPPSKVEGWAPRFGLSHCAEPLPGFCASQVQVASI